MSQSDKTNPNGPHNEPPLDLACSTDTLAPEQRSHTQHEPWTPEISDTTMLSAASLSREHDTTGVLFDESELQAKKRSRVSQKNQQAVNKIQEAEGENASPRAKTKN